MISYENARLHHWLAFILLASLSLLAHAQPQHGFPAAYAPQVIQPQVMDGKQVLDLRPAQQQARKTGKRLYVYLGADNCPYCRAYERFLLDNASSLVPQFAKDYLVVDLRGSLKWRMNDVVLQTESHRLPYVEFQNAIGDERTRALVFPSVWLLRAEGTPLMQMPSGAGTFMTVGEQLEILRLQQ